MNRRFSTLLALAYFTCVIVLWKWHAYLQEPQFLSPAQDQSVVEGEPRFLMYAAHSGFSNQLLGLARAAVLARMSNRVLVVPPILSHGAVAPGRADVLCTVEGQAELIDKAWSVYLKEDLGDLTHGEYSDLFWFDQTLIWNRFGLRLTHWKIFKESIASYKKKHWGKHWGTLGCSTDSRDASAFQEIQQELSQYEHVKILMIGSAFRSRISSKLDLKDPDHQNLNRIFRYFIVLPYTKTLHSLANSLKSGVLESENYLSMHIRSGDQNEAMEEVISRAIVEIQKYANSSLNVFIATDISKGLLNSVFSRMLEEFKGVVTFSDLSTLKKMHPAAANELKATASRLKLHPNLVDISLDQYICASSKIFIPVVKSDMDSTFTKLIQNRYFWYTHK